MALVVLVLLVLHLFIYGCASSLWTRIVITAVKNRQLGLRSVTEAKYRMQGNMFVTSQMRITFLLVSLRRFPSKFENAILKKINV